jgi:hypothetical protein
MGVEETKKQKERKGKGCERETYDVGGGENIKTCFPFVFWEAIQFNELYFRYTGT